MPRGQHFKTDTQHSSKDKSRYLDCTRLKHPQETSEAAGKELTSVQCAPLHGGAEDWGGRATWTQGSEASVCSATRRHQDKNPGEEKEGHCTSWIRSYHTSSETSYSMAGSRDYFQDPFIKKNCTFCLRLNNQIKCIQIRFKKKAF